MANILLVDDDEIMNIALSRKIGKMGHYVRYISTLQEAIDVIREEPWDLVFLDVIMPDGNGLDLLPRIRSASSKPEVIIFTAAGNIEGAKQAIQMGAWDYIEKGVSLDQTLQSMNSALECRFERIARKPPDTLRRDRIIGESESMKVCLRLISEAAATTANVLITGETGTGKELMAEAIHYNSARAENPLIVIDCTSLPETLIESVLFGHEKGAFTGAFQPQEGLFKQADGGTLFLDEVGELPPSHQKAFLRILQEHRFRPIGSKKEVSSDFRVVAATNRNLDKMVQEREFRHDLLYRLRSLVIVVPSLRERIEDIPAIVDFQMKRICTQYKMEPKQFSADFFDALASYAWPGNIRELINALEYAIAGARQDRTLYPHHLPIEIRLGNVIASIGGSSGRLPSEETGRVTQLSFQPQPPHQAPSPPRNKQKQTEEFHSGNDPAIHPRRAALPKLKSFLKENEKRYLQELLILSKGSVMEASRISGISRARLYVHLKRHGLASPAQSPAPPSEDIDASPPRE